MAAGMLPRPGTEVGPCETDCDHKDCAATMAMATAPCAICSKPVGFQTRFYEQDAADYPGHAPIQGVWTVGEHVLVHADCLEDHIDAQQKARKAAAR